MNKGVTGRAGNAKHFRPLGQRPQRFLKRGARSRTIEPEYAKAAGREEPIAWAGVSQSAWIQPPTRVRVGADRQITRDVVRAALEEFWTRGGEIQRIGSAFPPEKLAGMRKTLKYYLNGNSSR